MTVKDFKKIFDVAMLSDDAKIVVAKKKKRGGYKVFPQVVEANGGNLPIIGPCFAIVYED